MYRYATFRTRQMAIDYLQNCYAEGTVSPSEFAGLFRENGRWHIFLNAQ